MFIAETIPFLHTYAKVKTFWLPNCRVLQEAIEESEHHLHAVGIDWFEMRDPKKNPLYVATDRVDKVLRDSPVEVKTNENQVSAYLDKDYPFLYIQIRK